MARALITTLATKLKLDDPDNALTPLATVSGAALDGCTYTHPLFDRTSPVIIGGDYITTDAGTGLVHTAPGHGQEDYMTAQQYAAASHLVLSTSWPQLSGCKHAGLTAARSHPGVNVCCARDRHVGRHVAA